MAYESRSTTQGAGSGQQGHADEGRHIVALRLPNQCNGLRPQGTEQRVNQDHDSENAAVMGAAVMRGDQNLDARKGAAESHSGEHGIAVEKCRVGGGHLAQ